jgi:ABC-2 type transport system permease protein
MFAIYTVFSIALMWMYIALFPSFSKVDTSFMNAFPEGMMKAFNFDINSFVTIQGFLSTEQFSFIWPMLMIALTVGYGGYAFAGEIEKGTIEFLLAKPVSRLNFFFSRYLVGLVMLVVFTPLTILAAIPLCKLYDINLSSSHFYTFVWLSLLFGVAIYNLAIMLSAIFSEKGKVFFLSIGLTVLMYVINIISTLKESLSDIKYVSFFYYYNPPKALIYNQIDQYTYWMFGGVAVVSLIVALVVFTRRDIST